MKPDPVGAAEAATDTAAPAVSSPTALLSCHVAAVAEDLGRLLKEQNRLTEEHTAELARLAEERTAERARLTEEHTAATDRLTA